MKSFPFCLVLSLSLSPSLLLSLSLFSSCQLSVGTFHFFNLAQLYFLCFMLVSSSSASFFCAVLLVLSFWFRRDSFWTRVLCCLSMCGFIFG